MNGANLRRVGDYLLRVAFVHFGLENVDDFLLSHCCQHVLRGPITVENLIILLELHTASVLLWNGINSECLVQRGSCKLIIVLIEGE